jgi:hypothetical protein
MAAPVCGCSRSKRFESIILDVFEGAGVGLLLGEVALLASRCRQASVLRSGGMQHKRCSSTPNNREIALESMKPMKPMTPLPSLKPWWSEGLGEPASSGAQEGMRYAFFPDKKLLLIEKDGKLQKFDTAEHQIGGFSQVSRGQALVFRGRRGPVKLADLRKLTS